MTHPPNPNPPPPPHSPPPPPRDWDRIVLPAALITILAVSITLTAMRWFSSKNSADQKTKTDAAITMLQQLLQQDNSQMRLLHSQLAGATQPSLAGLECAQLAGIAPAKALFFIDADSNQWFLLAENLSPPITGSTLRVWITSNQTTLSSAAITVNDLHSAVLTGRLPATPNAPITCIITQETSSTSNAPTGPVILKGVFP